MASSRTFEYESPRPAVEVPPTEARFKAGDKIVKLAGREIRNVYDYTYALGEMKAGQQYEVELLRAGQRLKVVITPAARK